MKRFGIFLLIILVIYEGYRLITLGIGLYERENTHYKTVDHIIYGEKGREKVFVVGKDEVSGTEARFELSLSSVGSAAGTFPPGFTFRYFQFKPIWAENGSLPKVGKK